MTEQERSEQVMTPTMFNGDRVLQAKLRAERVRVEHGQGTRTRTRGEFGEMMLEAGFSEEDVK